MPCGVWKVTDIPSSEVGGVMADYEIYKPETLEKTQQPDGNWTVTATFPPCPPGQQSLNTSSHSA